MNSRLLCGVAALALSPCGHAVTLMATFDGLNAASNLSGLHAEGGIQFSSPSAFGVATGSYAAALFGGGGYYAHGSALYVHNTGWVDISAPGHLMAGAAFTYGFDWSFHAIEYGLMDVVFEWETLLDGVVTGNGSLVNGRDNRSHGGIGVDIVDGGTGFDQLRIRSLAVEYQGIYTGGTGPGGWLYERGAPIGWGAQNHIAFDNVRIDTVAPVVAASAFSAQADVAPVPDRADPLVLLVVALGGVWGLHRWLRRGTMGRTQEG